MRYSKLWFLLIMLIGFGLRLLLLARQSLWYDEGVTWFLSQMSLPELLTWTAEDIQPPLYYGLLWAAKFLFGSSEWALRFPSVLAGTLAIPLLFSLAKTLLPANRPAPWLAAALAAGSPLLVYYSQEARMYTLLVAEAILAGYLLLKLLQIDASPPVWRPRRYALLYLLMAAAALYTHYFAAFLLLAHAIYAAFILWRWRFPAALVGQVAWAFGGAMLLFLPWLPILLARLGDDPSYWPGALNLPEALRKIAISFTLGETVIEQTGAWLALGYLILLLLAGLWALFNRQSTSRFIHHSSFTIHHSLFIFLWLAVPLLSILLLSYQSPKFNPRYTLLAWPAFALLLAAILGRLAAPPRRAAALALSALFYGFIIATFTFSLLNWFTDPRFSKADFRALARFVQERRAADETVLLSSGHMFPVWAYYYGWQGWTPLPNLRRLDVSRVLSLEVANQLVPALANHGGAWLVSWQDEVIDPTGAVPLWLDVAGHRPGDAGDFWGVGLEHWRLDAHKLPRLAAGPIEQTLAVNFNNYLDLVGATPLSDTELALFWRPRQPLPDNLALSLRLTDPDGFDWGRETLTGPLGYPTYPTSRWPVGQVIATRHPLPWLTGTPPGQYVAEIGLGLAADGGFAGWDVLDAQGRPQRRTALVEALPLSRVVPPPADAPPAPGNPSLHLTLRRVILPQTGAQPGDRLPLSLLWQAGQEKQADVSLAFDLLDAAGQNHPVGSWPTPSRDFALSRWLPGQAVLGQYWLDIPPSAAPGPAWLVGRLVGASGEPGGRFPIGAIEIQPTERNFTPPPALGIPVQANFTGQAVLLGVDCPAGCAAAAGQSLPLTLYWQAGEARFETAYTVFVHLLGQDETVLLNADHLPPKPTLGWVPGEIITDPLTLTLPPDVPPGSYALEIGMYNAADPAFTRLPLTTGETRVLLPGILTVSE